MSEQEKAHMLVGRVISSRMDKTVTVAIPRRVKHPLYKKYITRTTKVHAHDEDNQCREGDTVAIEQCRPLSKTKAWRLVKVLEHSIA